MALNVVYFRFTHRTSRPHYMWDKYLYSVLEKVEVRVIVYRSVCVLVVVDLGLTTLLTSQVISVALYSEREKSDKFCSEAQFRLEFLLRDVNLRHGNHDFASIPKEVILRIFTLRKNPSTPAGFEPANLGSSGEYDNHGTTSVDCLCSVIVLCRVR